MYNKTREASHGFKDERTQSLICQLAAQFLQLESNGRSLITVTRCDIENNGHDATIFLSVYPAEQGPAAFEFAKRKRKELREYIKENSRLGRLPFLEIVLEQQ